MNQVLIVALKPFFDNIRKLIELPSLTVDEKKNALVSGMTSSNYADLVKTVKMDTLVILMPTVFRRFGNLCLPLVVNSIPQAVQFI